MKVLITGGAGYIGSRLAGDLVNKGHDVIVYDLLEQGDESLRGFREYGNFHLIKGDIRDEDHIKECLIGIDGIVHLAAVVGIGPCHDDPPLARDINVNATRSLVDIARKSDARRLVFASTCSVYGNTGGKLADEESEVIPINEYGYTKHEAEQYVISMNGNELSTCALRFATATGPSYRMRYNLLPAEFVKDAYHGNSTRIRYWDAFRPYIDVRDISRAISLALESGDRKVSGKIFNVADDDQNFTKEDLARMVKGYFPDWDVIFDNDMKTGDLRNYRVSGARIRKALGFRDTIPINKSIEDMIALLESSDRKR